MTHGPPPSAAESSAFAANNNRNATVQSTAQPGTVASLSNSTPTPSRTTGQQQQGYYSYSTWPNNWSATYSHPTATPATPQPSNFYSTYPSIYHAPIYPQQTYGQPYYPYQPSYYAPSTVINDNTNVKQKVPSPSPSPPPPESYQHWDEVVVSFLKELGLLQSLNGFECDMLVLNSRWERDKVPGALKSLVKRLETLQDFAKDTESSPDGDAHALEERKLNYVHLPHGEQPQSQTSINKSISRFLAHNRTRNDTSNRIEFLQSLAEKRRRLNDAVDFMSIDDENGNNKTPPSCARVDAKPIDRDVQMKYDIAKNVEGPLRRTVKNLAGVSEKKTDGMDVDRKVLATVKSVADEEAGLPARYPALDERLKNIESHLSIRYVPSPPRTLLARLKHLEDHIIKLEKEYPPWAALHFNQPNRGWPPPPRSTPIIVPPNQRTTEKDSSEGKTPSLESTHNVTTASGRPPRAKNKSSLHRAVLERLEVQQAMSDLAGNNGSSG